MKNKIRLASLTALIAGLATTVSAQVAHYTFDSTYKSANAQMTPNSGTGGEKSKKGALEINTLDMRMYGLDSANISLATAPGVGGKGNALDLSCNLPGKIPAAIAQQTAAAPGAFKALTITGWLKVKSPLEKDTTIIRNFNNGKGPGCGGFWVSATSKNSLVLIVGDGDKHARAPITNNALTNPDQWLFFAVTWDGASGMAYWYFGSENDAVSMPIRTAVPASKGITLAAVKQLGLGRSSSKSVGYCGLMDDIRIYDTALDQDKIEEVRSSVLGK